MIHPMPLTVASVADTIVTVTSADGQTFRLAREAVYGTPAVGQEVKLIAVAVGSEDAGETAFARKLLNQLLGSSA